MKTYIYLLILFVNATFPIPMMPQQNYHGFVTGIVVDENGRPAVRASVTFDNFLSAQEGKTCWAKEHELMTDGIGQFFLNEYCNVPNRTIFLFTEAGDLPANVQFPIHAPFWPELRRSDTRFAGLRVELNGNQTIDLDKIPVQVWYNSVEVSVLAADGRPLYKSENDWAKFVLIVRNLSGNAVGSETLSAFDRERSVRVDRGSVNLALPEGSWILELLPSLDDFDIKRRTLRYLAKTTVSVKRSDVCLQVRLVVK